MKHTKQLLFLAISLFTFFNSQAQERFERLYRATDRDHIGVDIQQTRDGGYLVLSIPFDADSSSFPNANVTRLSPKGDINWSKDYTFDESIRIDGSLVLLEKDSFAFAVIESKLGLNKIVTKADPSGNVVWSKAFGTPNDDGGPVPTSEKARLIAMEDNGITLFGTALKDGSPNRDLYVSRTDSTGNLVWAKTYGNPGIIGAAEKISAVEKTIDGGFIFSGLVNPTLGDIFLISLDSLGNVMWGRSYRSLLNHLGNLSITQLPDKGFLVGGSKSGIGVSGFFMRVDSLGNFEWARTLEFPTIDSTLIEINHLLVSSDSTVVAAGFVYEFLSDSTSAFMMEFNLNGDTIWQRKYKNIFRPLNFSPGKLIATEEGGYAFYTSFENPFVSAPIPYLIKVDKEGFTSCEDSLDVEISLAGTLVVGTFILQVTSVDTVLIKEPEVMPYDSFSVPVLSLASATFCPDEPIFATFDATVLGAVSYLWSTGETTPMITVTEEGQFTVDVRVEADICFNLCDTATVSVIPFPTVQIDAFVDDFCTEGFIQLQASGMGIAGLEWSTGAVNTAAILITETGNYSVTATNSCGSGFDDININELPNTPPEITTGIDVGDFCTDGIATLLVFGTGINEILWQETGDTTATSQVNAAGTYNVVATNLCGSTSGEISFETNPPLLRIQPEVDSFCSDGFATLVVIGLGIDSLQWSTGEATDTIQVSELTTYSATAFSNFCGDATEELNLADVVPDCSLALDNCIQLPNAFTPNGDGTNDSFGPVFLDECSLFTVVEFAIYSRWGEKVFSTNAPDEKWDGTQGGDPAAIDVYAWMLVAVGNDGKEQRRQGEVSLLR